MKSNPPPKDPRARPISSSLPHGRPTAELASPGSAAAASSVAAQSSDQKVAEGTSQDHTGPWPVEQWVTVLAKYLAPTTVFIGLLYYFGYIRSVSLYNYFGLDLRALNLSTEDYLLRGVDALYAPLGLLMIVILAALWGRWFLMRAIGKRHPSRVRVAALAVAAVGVLLFISGVIGVIEPDLSWPLLTPLSLGLGMLAAAFGISLALRRENESIPSGMPRVASSVLVWGVVTLSLFWTANQYAQAYGTGRAQTLSEELTERPSVILDVKERLYADAPGVEETSLSEDGEYRFRYRGYRLFAQSDTTIFLIPEQWTPGGGAILALPNNSEMRIQFRAP
jgi:hypothetical protein